MSVLSLLLGNRRLRRNIEAQTLQMRRDIEHAKFTTAQLRRTFGARAASPLGLASAVATGFVIGKLRSGHRRSLTASAVGTIGGVAAAAFAAVRTLGWQFLMPAAINWAQTKLIRSRAPAPASADADRAQQ
ncbi:MAG TPA: hypothetical protein VGK97_05030 [Spongiibacteraceae bacterium]